VVDREEADATVETGFVEEGIWEGVAGGGEGGQWTGGGRWGRGFMVVESVVENVLERRCVGLRTGQPLIYVPLILAARGDRFARRRGLDTVYGKHRGGQRERGGGQTGQSRTLAPSR